jgi:hypothetical protein
MEYQEQVLHEHQVLLLLHEEHRGEHRGEQWLQQWLRDEVPGRSLFCLRFCELRETECQWYLDVTPTP